MSDRESAQAGGFLSGLAHPVSGLDHVLAMVAVGLWGAVLVLMAVRGLALFGRSGSADLQVAAAKSVDDFGGAGNQ